MAAEGTIKTVILCVTFLACFIAMIALIPTDFFVASKDYTQYDVPEYFSQNDIQSIKHFLNYTTPFGEQTLFDFNLADNPTNQKIRVMWLGPPTNEESFWFAWINWDAWIGPFYMSTASSMWITNVNTGQRVNAVNKAFLLSAYDADFNTSIFYPVKSEGLTVKVWVYDSNRTRNDISTAWDEHELAMGIGFGFEDYETKLSAWDIVGRLLTFQSPEVFGATGATALALNLVVGIPFWAAVAVCVYLLIMEAIPF